MLRFVRESDVQRIERLKKVIGEYLSGKSDEVAISDEDLRYMLIKTEERVYDELNDSEEIDIISYSNSNSDEHQQEGDNRFPADAGGEGIPTGNVGGNIY